MITDKSREDAHRRRLGWFVAARQSRSAISQPAGVKAGLLRGVRGGWHQPGLSEASPERVTRGDDAPSTAATIQCKATTGSGQLKQQPLDGQCRS